MLKEQSLNHLWKRGKADSYKVDLYVYSENTGLESWVCGSCVILGKSLNLPEPQLTLQSFRD